jgi:hypothetical protein
VHARAVSRALGLEETRKSRPASAALIARKLMLLDCVVGEADVTWYATEYDKVALFAQQFGVPEADLPQRVYEAEQADDGTITRYFPHNLPMYVTPDAIVHLVYLALDVTARGLEQFLFDHALLIRHLPQWAVVCLRPAHLGPLPRAEAAFRRSVSPVATATQGSASLARHFHVRRAVDQGELANVSVAELYAFRAAQRRLSTPAVEQQYREWLRSGDSRQPWRA